MEIYRGRIMHFLGDPKIDSEHFIETHDGLLAISEGKILASGPYQDLRSQFPKDVPIKDFGEQWILPGFIDGHVHYPQTEMIGAYGEQLLSWLNRYTFPTELQFSDLHHARSVAETFLAELFRNGTTTALVFATVHPTSVDAFFEAAQSRNARMICGKVLMDRNAPKELCESPDEALTQTQALIDRWHKHQRLLYAITPRFAPACSDALLSTAGLLLKNNPTTYLHTHVSENTDEVAWVKQLFPQCKDYLEVYEQAGLLGKRSVFAHGIHLNDRELQRLSQTQSCIAHCPSSNCFLGSGLFPLQKIQQHNISVCLGSDIGAGTSFSPFRTMDHAYKIQQLQNHTLSPLESFYMSTLGAAKALDIESFIGNLEADKEADFIVIDPQLSPLLERRLNLCKTPEERLFALQTLGDDRIIAQTFINGYCQYTNPLSKELM